MLDKRTDLAGPGISTYEEVAKILPTDYERVLNALARAEESGLKGDDAILAAFEENAKVGH